MYSPAATHSKGTLPVNLEPGPTLLVMMGLCVSGTVRIPQAFTEVWGNCVKENVRVKETEIENFNADQYHHGRLVTLLATYASQGWKRKLSVDLI